MMLTLNRKSLGLTIFEILLVLLVISVLAVAAARYFMNQQETKADQVYGQNLYTYGQAAYQYVYNNTQTLVTTNTLMNASINAANPGLAGITAQATTAADQALYPGYDTKLIIPGVAWLNQNNAGANPSGGSAYLANNFNLALGVSPLIVALPKSDGSGPDTTKEGSSSVTTTIYYSVSSPSTAPQLAINFGALYEQGSSAGNPTYTLRPDLTQAAIQHANHLFTSYQGPSALYYSYPYTTAPIPAAAQPLAIITPQAQEQAYLEINGGNMMLGTINFANAGSEITNVGVISFIKGFLSNVTQINMVQNGGIAPQIGMDPSLGGTISDVASLNMHNQGGIQNLQTLSFSSSSAAGQNQIQNLDILYFRTAGISKFQGMMMGPSGSCQSNNNCNTNVAYYDSSMNFASVCFITGMSTGVATETVGVGVKKWNQTCQISTALNNQWVVTAWANGPGASPEPIFCYWSCVTWSK